LQTKIPTFNGWDFTTPPTKQSKEFSGSYRRIKSKFLRLEQFFGKEFHFLRLALSVAVQFKRSPLFQNENQ
jgi:hypothetical protein